MKYRGEVVSGLRRGAYFIRIYSSRIRKLAGFLPYPGTLNVRVRKSPVMRTDLKINRFRKGGVLFGEARLHRCRLNGLDVYIIWPEKARHEKDVIEFISDRWLRKELGLRDGSRITIESS